MRKHYTTHPAEGQTKNVIPGPRTTPETTDQRRQRLMDQAGLNRLRVHDNQDGTYTVPSGRRDASGQPKERYLVRTYPGLGGYACECVWGAGNEFCAGHGLYCAENEIALCSHIAQVVKHEERDAREAARAAARLAA